MTPKEKAAVVYVCASIALSVAKTVSIVKEERRKREHIRAEGARDIEAIQYAAAKVNENLHAGEYDGKNFNVVLNDIRFYEIARRAEKG